MFYSLFFIVLSHYFFQPFCRQKGLRVTHQLALKWAFTRAQEPHCDEVWLGDVVARFAWQKRLIGWIRRSTEMALEPRCYNFHPKPKPLLADQKGQNAGFTVGGEKTKN